MIERSCRTLSPRSCAARGSDRHLVDFKGWHPGQRPSKTHQRLVESEKSHELPLSHAIYALNAVANASEDAAYVGGKLLIIPAFAIGAILLGSITLRRRTS